MSKLIPARGDDVGTAEITTQSRSVTLSLPSAPVSRPGIADGLPPDVAKAIEREQAADPSDPFLTRRLVAHYKQGIWTPAG